MTPTLGLPSSLEIIRENCNYFVKDFLTLYNFEFCEKNLEYRRKTKDFTQLIIFKRSHNNFANIIVDFGIEFGNYSPRFEKWYKKTYNNYPSYGKKVVGNENSLLKNWNGKYQKHADFLFGYDLVNADIEHQFYVILENIQNAIIPYLNKFIDFETVIDCPNKVFSSGEIDLFSQIRQVEHLLFLEQKKMALDRIKQIRGEYLQQKSIVEQIDFEYQRIFKNFALLD